MARSIKLGHCVCDPQKPCPCDEFKHYNVCTCAGERLPVKTGNVPLTHHIRKAGCASKIGQADLKRILGTLPALDDPRVLLGTPAGDDAGIYAVDDKYYLVQTVDVFTPTVDDAYLFGQIAAANSLSDVYAMGGKPISALSVIGFPIDTIDGSIMEQLLRGGMDTLNEAGCALIGGHSINDAEIKMGFAITGLIDKIHIVARDNAQPGDMLVLTKPLGTGMISFATQLGRINSGYLEDAGQSMATLNKDAAELMVEHNAHACTDITGFALMGHLVEMILGSSVSAEIDMSHLPVFAPVKACLDNEILPGAIERNQEYSMAWAKVEDDSHEENLPILYDPQTSGGLLVALAKDDAEQYVEDLHERGIAAAAIIGRIVEKEPGTGEGCIRIVNTELKNFTSDPASVRLLSKEEAESIIGKEDIVSIQQESNEEEAGCCAPDEEPCCASPPEFDDEDDEESSSRETDSRIPAPPPAAGSRSERTSLQCKKKFSEFMKEVNKEGAIDTRTKKLMAIALSIAEHCDPCLKMHIKSALDMGFTKEEIDEAAFMAISFCGAPAMMFYNDVCKELKL